MRKVLFLGPYYLHPVVDRDTVHNVIPDLFRAVRDAGGTPMFLTGLRNSVLIEELRGGAPPCQIVTVDSRRPNGLSRLRFIAAAARLASRGDVAVITNVCGAISYGFDAVMAGRLSGVRAVVRVSGNERLTRRLAGRYGGPLGDLVSIVDRLRERLAFRFADAVVVMSKREFDRACNLRGGARDVAVARRGVDLRRFTIAARTAAASAQVPMRVLFVGRRSKEKGYDIFLEIAYRFRGRADFRFTMVGDFEASAQDNVSVRGYVAPSVYLRNFGRVKLSETSKD